MGLPLSGRSVRSRHGRHSRGGKGHHRHHHHKGSKHLKAPEEEHRPGEAAAGRVMRASVPITEKLTTGVVKGP